MEELKIDPEFQALLPELTPDEYNGLKQDIIDCGKIRRPIVTWHGYIIDGHHRYRISQETGIPFETESRDDEYEDHEEVLHQMRVNALHQRNLNDWERCKIADEEKKSDLKKKEAKEK